MKLRTEVGIHTSPYKISLDHKVFTIGSCFVDHMSHYLRSNKLQTLHNPFGNVYNPISILNIINGAIGSRDNLRDKAYVKTRDELKVSLHFHSDINARSEDELLDNIDLRLDSTYEFLKSADWAFITFGTAVGYLYQGKADNTCPSSDIPNIMSSHKYSKHKYNQKAPYNTMVGNCHKLPASDFHKVYVDLQITTDLYRQLVLSLRQINPHIKIILSLSPVRYFQPSLIENSKSKAILRLLIDNIIDTNTDIYYFPSYEILSDELRDYRYYNPDLVQPSSVAVQYILDHFVDTYISPRYKQFILERSKVTKVIKHKPLNPHSSNYKSLLERTINRISDSDFSEYLSEEIALLETKLR